MLKEQIDQLIKQSMLDGDKDRTKVLRAIKNEFLVYQTAKGAKPLDDAAELAILQKMVKQRLDSRDQFNAAGRDELALGEVKEILVLESFLPREASAEEINDAVLQVICEKGWGDRTTGPQIPKKCMGEVIKLVKIKLNNVNGKLLSECVKTYLV